MGVHLLGQRFFNRAGPGRTTGPTRQGPAGRYVPLAADVCPTGALAAVQGTPFHFRQARAVADAIATPHEQLAVAGGLDHYLVLDEQAAPLAPPSSFITPPGLRLAALLFEPVSGRAMGVGSTAPGVQGVAGPRLNAAPRRGLGPWAGQGRLMEILRGEGVVSAARAWRGETPVRVGRRGETVRCPGGGTRGLAPAGGSGRGRRRRSRASRRRR